MSQSLALLLASQGGGGAIRQFELARSSRTITAAYDGIADILLIGGGPSGGAAFNGFVAGPGAPGVCIKRFRVTAGQQYVVSIGAAVAGVTRSSAGATQGNAGNASTVTGPGVAMTANGGQPGESKTTKPVYGGLGGTATGGDLNRQGGSGGDIQATAAANAAAGAGACNLKGLNPATEIRGGTMNTTGAAAVTGGAGVGGRGADITGAAAAIWASGGGYGGPPTDNTDATDVRGPNAMGVRQAASPTEILVQLATQWGIDHFGGGGYGTNVPGPGGGSGNTPNAAAPRAGIFAGPAGSNGTAGPAPAGNVGPGGGIAHTASCTSGAGDAGLCVFIIRG